MSKAQFPPAKTDKKKFDDNWDSIDWSSAKKAVEEKMSSEEYAKKNLRNTKHSTAGLCGEFGMSTFDKEEFDKNFDNIKWTEEPSHIGDNTTMND